MTMVKICCCLMLQAMCVITASAQAVNTNKELLDTLNLISAGGGPSAAFAGLYHLTIDITNLQAEKTPANIKQAVYKFQQQFSPVFFLAHNNYIHNKAVHPNWQHYYGAKNANDLQYKFMGMNAHINGDMWVALTRAFSYDSLVFYRKPLLKFQAALNSLYDSVYVTTKQYHKVKQIHLLTLGLDKPFGKYLVYKWRKRQFRLAMLYYSRPQKFSRKLLLVQHKMKRLDSFAAKWLK